MLPEWVLQWHFADRRARTRAKEWLAVPAAEAIAFAEEMRALIDEKAALL